MTTTDDLSPGDLLLAWAEAAKIGLYGAMAAIAARVAAPSKEATPRERQAGEDG